MDGHRAASVAAVVRAIFRRAPARAGGGFCLGAAFFAIDPQAANGLFATDDAFQRMLLGSLHGQLRWPEQTRAVHEGFDRVFADGDAVGAIRGGFAAFATLREAVDPHVIRSTGEVALLRHVAAVRALFDYFEREGNHAACARYASEHGIGDALAGAPEVVALVLASARWFARPRKEAGGRTRRPPASNAPSSPSWSASRRVEALGLSL